MPNIPVFKGNKDRCALLVGRTWKTVATLLGKCLESCLLSIMGAKYSFLFLIICWMGCTTRNGEGQEKLATQSLTSPAKSESGEPLLFTTLDSTVYLSWLEINGSKTSLKYSSLDGGQWSTPATIASGDHWFVNWADFPAMAVNGKSLLAHYLDTEGEGNYSYNIKIVTSIDGGTVWSGPLGLHDDKKQAEHGFVSILPYENGFFVTWLDGRNTVMEGMEEMKGHEGHHGAMSLRAAILDAAGNKLNEWELDNKTCDCCQTSAAITTSGPVVVYRDRSDQEIRDISIVRYIDGKWTAPMSIHDDQWKINGCPVNGPRIAAHGNDLAIAWYSAAADSAKVHIIFSSDAGASFGKAIRVDEGNTLGRVDVELLSREIAVVSWMEGTQIKAVKVHSDGTKEPSWTIATTSEARSSGFPQMTRSGNRLIFAWTDDGEKQVKIASLLLE